MEFLLLKPLSGFTLVAKSIKEDISPVRATLLFQGCRNHFIVSFTFDLLQMFVRLNLSAIELIRLIDIIAIISLPRSR